MKDNWNRWQGYTFYTQPQAIEKCVTVTFSLGMQPVVAFVGGLQFEILPKPLFELGTTVCWPNQQPGGVDLSVLRSEVKSAGILLFSRTLRLTKRFGGGTDFVSSNYKGGYKTWRTNAGIASGETGVPKDLLRRTSFLETNQSYEEESEEEEFAEEAEEDAEMQWRTDSEDLYLASVDYGVNLNTSVNKTFEAFGEEAAMHMGTERVGKDVFKLFSFKNPGLVNFKIEGLMNGNILEMGMEMGFGPYSSPSRRIPLVNIAHQFSLILAGMPFVSSRSKLKAIASLNDFSSKDMGKTRGLPMKPGSIIALYSPHCRRFMHMNGGGLGVTNEMNGHGVPDHWTWERFTVVDAGNGEIALHSATHNRFVGPGGVSPHRNVGDLPHDWSSERFTVVEVGNGETAFYNRHHNKFLNMAASGVGASGHPSHPPKLPAGWTWERFQSCQQSGSWFPAPQSPCTARSTTASRRCRGGTWSEVLKKVRWRCLMGGPLNASPWWMRDMARLPCTTPSTIASLGWEQPALTGSWMLFLQAGPPRSGTCGRLGTAKSSFTTDTTTGCFECQITPWMPVATWIHITCQMDGLGNVSRWCG